MKSLRMGTKILDLSRPQVMAILNLTPDSFYDGGQLNSDTSLLRYAEKCLNEGAAILDVGGYSSRPGASEVPFSEEIRRIKRPIQLLRQHFPAAHLSVDTFRAQVAEVACSEGAQMVNDISGGTIDQEMLSFIARHQLPYVLMHMRGTPQSMSKETAYKDLEADIFSFLQQRLYQLRKAGVADVLLDPGFGFAKNVEQNFRILKNLSFFTHLGAPLLVGLSRKSMIYKTLSCQPSEALTGTAALHMYALEQGASILRVHDVTEARQVIQLYEAINS